MAKETDHFAKLIANAERVIDYCHAQLAVEPPPDAVTQQQLMQTIDGQLAKIARAQYAASPPPDAVTIICLPK